MTGINGTLYIDTPEGFQKLAECNDIQVAEEITSSMSETFMPYVTEPISFTCEEKDSNLENFLPPPEPKELPTMINYYKIQKRAHHKTRINKKWAKRYGYWFYEDIYNVEWIRKDILEYEARLTFKERQRYAEE